MSAPLSQRAAPGERSDHVKGWALLVIGLRR
jgi:hypothetical protein